MITADRQFVVFDKANQQPLGFYLNTHMVFEAYGYNQDDWDVVGETNGYISYVDPDGHVRYVLMSEVLLALGEADG